MISSMRLIPKLWPFIRAWWLIHPIAVFCDLLFTRGHNGAGIIILSPKQRVGGIPNFVAIEPSQTHAENIASSAIARLRTAQSG